MAKYRKRPVVIEAVRFLGDRGLEGRIPDWYHKACANRVLVSHKGSLIVHTTEGSLFASPGDYIIQGVEGELYPCKPSIFEATYEPVKEDVT